MMNENGWRGCGRAALYLSGVSFAALALSSSPASAQTAQVPNEEIESPAKSTDVIVVTASRIQRDGFDAPTPTTVLDSSELDTMAQASIADAVNTIPAFQPSRTPSTNTLNAVSAGANFLDLRGIGPNRTLVLLDGRRVAPTTDTNLVDANLFPSALVKRVEVVTGGASAAWGSDAVAGVANFILDSEFEGIKGQAQFGRSWESDGDEYKVAAAYGGSFAGGRGHILLGGEIYDNAGILKQSSRDWGRKKWQLIGNPAYTPTNGEPLRVISQNVNQSLTTYGGLIVSGPLRGTQFGPGGAPTQFQYGAISSIFQIGGDGLNLGQDVAIYQPNDRQNLFGRITFDVSDRTTIFAEAGYARSHSDNAIFPAWNFGNILVRDDNAYLPESIRQAMAANNVTSFAMGRINRDFGAISSDNTAETERSVVGARGEFGGDWSWDVYYQHGKTTNKVSLYNNPIVANLRLATDAVVNPVNGQIVCRSTLTEPDNGCVPINLFGPNAATGSPALDYVLGAAQTQYNLGQHVVAANIQAPPIALWAGDMIIAAGVEYREESVSSVADQLSLTNSFLTGNFQEIEGSRNIKEGYLEAVIPLVRDVPFFELLELNLAGRVTDYSTSGSVFTWKVGLSHQVSDDLRFRGTYSRDIRAPNLNELFNPASTTFATIFDPFQNSSVTIQQIQRGNTALQPEKGTTWTVGAIYEPSWLDGFRVSLDYFDIDLQGAISLLGIQDTIDRCFDGNVALCEFLNRDSSGTLTSIVRTNFNLAARSTAGFDIEAAYELPLSKISKGLGGTLGFQVYGSHVRKLVFDDGTVAIDRAGSLSAGTQGIPEWRWTGSATYKSGPFTGSVQARYISGGKYDATWGPLDINDNSIPSVTYVNLYAAYDIVRSEGDRSLTVFASVDNVFDRDPPIVASSFFAPLASNPALYDFQGRFVSVGARFKF
ncbi:TonB-dependent receptor [Parasphingorhabdus sp.]|uniref:TonB-dependent receptor n=1 Tax=Parasphingorhabdus sp. TaxID=2709688 RepID=UPI0032ECFF71